MHVLSSFPCSGSMANPKPGPLPTRVRAIDSRIACEITFPRLLGYRYELPTKILAAKFTADSGLTLTTADLPIKTENAPIVGESSIHSLDELKGRRINEVAFLLAKLTLEKYFRQDGESRPEKTAVHKFDGEVQAWLFPQVLTITKRWLDHPEELSKAFAKAWYKLLHRDMGPLSRYLGPWIAEPQLWQDPVPEVDHKLVDDKDVAALKKKVLDSGLSVPKLVKTAWSAAGSYRNTDKRV